MRAAKTSGVSPSCSATRAQEEAALSLSPVGTAAGSRLVAAVTTEGRPSGSLPVRPTGIQELSGRDQADFSGSGTLSAKVLPGHDHDCPGPGFILKKNAHFCMAARSRCPANTFGFSAGELSDAPVFPVIPVLPALPRSCRGVTQAARTRSESCSGEDSRSFPDFGVGKRRKSPQAEENIGKRIRIKKSPA